MSLCVGTNGCGCSLQSASLVVTGSGAPGSPWTIEGASPMRITEAQRLALAGGSLFNGLHVWTTDNKDEWVYDGSTWRMVYGRYSTSISTALHVCPASSISGWVNFDATDTYDPYNWHSSPSTEITVPTGGAGEYILAVRVQATSSTFAVDSHIVVDFPGPTSARGGALGVASAILPRYCGLHDLSDGDLLHVRVQSLSVADRNALVEFRAMRIGRYP